jgi:hypothetical protein
MNTQKKIFLFVGALFVLGVIIMTIDIFSRTTRPGAKKHLIESIAPSDTAKAKSRR